MHKSIDQEIKSGALKGLLVVLLPALLLVAYVALPGWAWAVILPAALVFVLAISR